MGMGVVDNANVQVDRYKKEWLRWESGMDDETFLRTFLWRIDDPTINVYPNPWVSCCGRLPTREILIMLGRSPEL